LAASLFCIVDPALPAHAGSAIAIANNTVKKVNLVFMGKWFFLVCRKDTSGKCFPKVIFLIKYQQSVFNRITSAKAEKIVQNSVKK
jgi:hypothetical protein